MPGILDLTPQQLGLLATGLGMMQNSRGRSTGEAFGAGGMQGLNAMYQAQQMQQKQALADAQQKRFDALAQRDQYKFDQERNKREALSQSLQGANINSREETFNRLLAADSGLAYDYLMRTNVNPSSQYLRGQGGLYYKPTRDGLEPAMYDGKQLADPAYDPASKYQAKGAEERAKIFSTKDNQDRDLFITGNEALGGSNVTRDQILALMPGLVMTESGGNPNAISPKGAKGITQWMPESASNPGYGVEPFDVNQATPQQQVGKTVEYLLGIAKEHPEWTLDQVVSAYNMGPGNTEQGRINNDYVNKVKNHPWNLSTEERRGFGMGAQEREAMQQEEKAKGAALKLQKEAQQKAIIDLPTYIDESNNLLGVIDKALNHPGLSDVVGMPSMLTYMPGVGALRGSNAAGFITLLNQIKGKAFLQAFETLKGGGHITEIEGKKATDAIARLDTAQSEEEFIDALNEFKSIIRKGMARAAQKAGKEYTPQEGNKFDGFTIERAD